MQKPGLFGMNGFLLFLLTCCSFAVQAQQVGSLVLIDAENKMPFTVRVGDQVLTSSGHGHLVIAHLKDSNYRFGIRFPKKAMAEQVFPVSVKQKDLGFQLQGSDSTWVLYNWQTKMTVRPVKDRDSSRILDMGVKREDGFSKLMAAVVDDSAVMYNSYSGNWFSRDSSNLSTTTASPSSPVQAAIPNQKQQQPANKSQLSTVSNQQSTPSSLQQPTALTATQLPAKKPDSIITKTDQLPAMPAPVAASAVQNTRRPVITPGVKKLREVNLKVSRKIVFLDTGPDGNKDTVTLFVFFENGDTAQKQPLTVSVAKKSPAGIADSAATTKNQAKNNGADVFVPGCGEQATSADLEWLRSAILKANSEQDKISAASAAFALKCFSVSQLRVLASLLVSDKARYRLMEAAHLHISDRDHFRELADMYTDKNFQRKFLVMADKRS